MTHPPRRSLCWLVFHSFHRVVVSSKTSKTPSVAPLVVHCSEPSQKCGLETSLRKTGGVSTDASAAEIWNSGSSRVFPDVSQDYLRQRVEESTQILLQRHDGNVDFQRLYEALVEDFLKNKYDKEPVASTSAPSGSKSQSCTPTRPLISSSCSERHWPGAR
jgi:hypothetical protein